MTAHSTDSLKLFAEVGKSYLQLKKELKQGPASSSGPGSIYLYSQTAKSIGVKESGSDETAQIWFEVLDSSNVPINADNSITLNFSLGGHPGGGNFFIHLQFKQMN